MLGAVALATLGCKVNQAESDHFARGFAAAGLRVVGFGEPADAYVINSCTVTHVADRKSRQLIRQARRANPDGLVVATGCYAAVAGEDLADSLALDLVVPNDHKARLIDLVLDKIGRRRATRFRKLSDVTHVPDDAEVTEINPVGNRTRAFVKVQDGCNSLCAFCIIPYARGRERSVPLEEAVAAVQERLGAGYQEVLLTGVHLGTFGHDLDPPASLRDLLDAVLRHTAVPRLRLSSIEPWNFDPAVLDLWTSGRLCRHLHLALQNGCDSVLRRMRRPYDVSGFERLLDGIRSAVPDIAITTDVIVGFPDESEAEFETSLCNVARLDFAAVHVFPYSPRLRTAASKMPGQVPMPIKRQRVAAMLEVARRAAERFRARLVDRTMNVLYMSPANGLGTVPGDGAGWEGLTDNYVRVLTPSAENLANRIVLTRLVVDDGEATALRGEVCASMAVAADETCYS